MGLQHSFGVIALDYEQLSGTDRRQSFADKLHISHQVCRDSIEEREFVLCFELQGTEHRDNQQTNNERRLCYALGSRQLRKASRECGSGTRGYIGTQKTACHKQHVAVGGHKARDAKDGHLTQARHGRKDHHGVADAGGEKRK